MNDVNVITVVVVIVGCCVNPIGMLFLGLFIGYRRGKYGPTANSPTGVKAKSASGKFAIDE